MADHNRPRYKSENEVWDPILLQWVPMQQPVIKADTLTITGAISQGTGGTSPWLVADARYVTELDYAGGTNPIYIGLANPGSSTSASVWQIKKLAFDSNNNPISILYANGSSLFNVAWDSRAALPYS